MRFTTAYEGFGFGVLFCSEAVETWAFGLDPFGWERVWPRPPVSTDSSSANWSRKNLLSSLRDVAWVKTLKDFSHSWCEIRSKFNKVINTNRLKASLFSECTAKFVYLYLGKELSKELTAKSLLEWLVSSGGSIICEQGLIEIPCSLKGSLPNLVKYFLGGVCMDLTVGLSNELGMIFIKGREITLQLSQPCLTCSCCHLKSTLFPKV